MKFPVSTSKYEFSHGRKPRGFGTWFFECRTVTFMADRMMYSDAVKAAQKHFVLYGTIEVMP